ncbi:hypothetical protein [Pedobacter sp. P26]|uniref:hypothetical protein n=1 Tax=Pedobacter sp. P26 TaxID=3423956 RepID=UPI003D67137A
MSKIKETSTNYANKQALADECLEVYTANIIGGQWALVICSWLMNGKLRFGELKKIAQYYRTNAHLTATQIRSR